MNYYELEGCVMRARNGNKAELLKILEQFKPLIIKNAKSIYIKNFDFYDLVQIGYVELINAVASYRKGSLTFAAYAATIIKNSYIDYIRENSCLELSLNAPINGEAGAGLEFIDIIEATEAVEDGIIDAENITELRKEVSRLPSDEMELVIMHYYSGISLKVFAEKKGLTYLQAYRKRDMVIKKLRKALEKRR